ncbi:MAG: type IV secretory system conjugative DNA transfer family protein [Acidiphilium sp.]|nr:type IV secretory system conjugative DNA transfer family protein [Acidiphilium sp.]
MLMPPRLRGDILETVLTYLDVWADPIVSDMTSRTDFTPGDLVCSDHPCSVYLQVPPTDDDRLKPLTRLILSQFASQLMVSLDKDAEGRKKRHKLLFLIDEFPSLGKLGFFSRNMRVMAGYGIKAMLTVQSFKDIIEAYGQHNTIIDNCHVTVAFASADNDTTRKISEMLGEPVEHRASYSVGSSDRGLFQGRNTRSVSEIQRRLLEPGEVRQLPYDTQLVLVTGSKPFRMKKIRYWLEKPWKDRATDIRAGALGPDQAQHLDVPRKGGFVSYWQTIQPINLAVKEAGPVNHDDEPAQNIALKLRDLELVLPEMANEPADSNYS